MFGSSLCKMRGCFWSIKQFFSLLWPFEESKRKGLVNIVIYQRDRRYEMGTQASYNSICLETRGSKRHILRLSYTYSYLACILICIVLLCGHDSNGSLPQPRLKLYALHLAPGVHAGLVTRDRSITWDPRDRTLLKTFSYQAPFIRDHIFSQSLPLRGLLLIIPHPQSIWSDPEIRDTICFLAIVPSYITNPSRRNSQSLEFACGSSEL